MAGSSEPFPLQARQSQVPYSPYNSRQLPVRRSELLGRDAGRTAAIGAIGPPPAMALPDLPPAISGTGSPEALNGGPGTPEKSYAGSSRASVTSRGSTEDSRQSFFASFSPGESYTSYGSSRASSAHPYAATQSPTAGRGRAPPSSDFGSTPIAGPSNYASTSSHTHSKSVLQVALAKANSAVEMDEANDVAGAIAAYGESVRLLRDVMARVDQQSSTWTARERERIANKRAAGTFETDEDRRDRERREERIDRREKARLEDIRRLKDIHDTYEERIAMLQGMPDQDAHEADQAGPLPEIARRSTASPPQSPRAPSLFEPQVPVPKPRRSSLQSYSSDKGRSPVEDEAGAAGIGAAMLAASSTMANLSMDDEQFARPTKHASQASTSSFRSGSQKRASGQSIASIISSAAPSVGSERASRPQRSSDPPPLPPPKPGLSSSLHRPNQLSIGTDSSGEFVIPVTATEFGLDWPSEAEQGISAVDGSHQRTGSSGLLVSVENGVASISGALDTGSGPSTPRFRNRSDAEGTSLASNSASSSSVRVASMGNTTSADTLAAAGNGLVSASTAQGTISQRRKPPPLSAAPQTPPSGGLAARLRTLSQPGKRPAPPEHAPPPLPPGAASGLRQVSAPMPSFAAKVSPPSLPPTPPSANPSVLSGSTLVVSDGSPVMSFSGSGTPTSSVFASSKGQRISAPLSSGVALHGDVAPLSATPAIRRPFEQMRRLSLSISEGAFLTSKLFVPPTAWAVAGVKLQAVETKIRMIELLISGLEGLERAGDAAQFGGDASNGVDRFARELDTFDGLLDGIQGTLAKKLGFVDGLNGKKSGASSIASKLSKSFDRMTNAKSLDAPALYVQTLTRLFAHATVIDRHLALSGSAGAFYASSSPDVRNHIDVRLKRASEFFGSVVCRFVLQDIGMLLDRHVKLAGRWMLD